MLLVYRWYGVYVYMGKPLYFNSIKFKNILHVAKESLGLYIFNAILIYVGMI
jgi:hypothetical protein